MNKDFKIDSKKKSITMDGFEFPIEKFFYGQARIPRYNHPKPTFSLWYLASFISAISSYWFSFLMLIPSGIFYQLGRKSIQNHLKKWEENRKNYLNSSEIIKRNTKYKLYKILYDYFKNNIPVYTDMKVNFTFLKSDTFSSANMDDLMFSIFKEAYLINADAIVINNNDVSNEVNGMISGYVSGGGGSRHIHGSTYGETSTETTFYKQVSFIKI